MTSWLTHSHEPQSLAELAHLTPGERRLSPELVSLWKKDLVRWGGGREAQIAADQLLDPETSVVVTGQQPGVLGGPLYLSYKVATALALSRKLSRETEKPSVAVFWMGSDDADWDEVAWAAVPDEHLKLERERWPSQLPKRAWLGDGNAPLGKAFQSQIAALDSKWSEWTRESNLAESLGQFLLRLFPNEPLVILDARRAELRTAGGPLWSTYFEQHEALTDLLQKEGANLYGDDPAIDAAALSQGLFVIEDRRRADLDQNAWRERVAAHLKAGEFDHLSPSVVLRAPLQDYLLGSSCQVVGEGERRYLKQLAPMYRALGIREPRRTSRLHATLLPLNLLDRKRLADAVTNPQDFLGELALTQIPKELLSDFEAIRSEGRQRLQDWKGKATAWAKDLAQVVDSGDKKIDFQYGRILEALERKTRQNLYAQEPALRNISEFLSPKRGLQERGLSAVLLPLWLGSQAGPELLSMSTAHLDRLLSGEEHHFALEVQRDG